MDLPRAWRDGTSEDDGIAVAALDGEATTAPDAVAGEAPEASGFGEPDTPGPAARATTRTRNATTISPTINACPPDRDDPASGASSPCAGSSTSGVERVAGHRPAPSGGTPSRDPVARCAGSEIGGTGFVGGHQAQGPLLDHRERGRWIDRRAAVIARCIGAPPFARFGAEVRTHLEDRTGRAAAACRLRCRRHPARHVRPVAGGRHWRRGYRATGALARTHVRDFGERPLTQQSRRRPIFPKGCPLSIFGAGELNFRVRDGNGCGLSARVTGIVCVWTMTAATSVAECDAGANRRITIAGSRDPISRHADPWSGAGIEVKPSTISTAQLHPSRDFHMPPIKQMVSLRSYPVNPVGNLILRRASHLDAFSAYPNRT